MNKKHALQLIENIIDGYPDDFSLESFQIRGSNSEGFVTESVLCDEGGYHINSILSPIEHGEEN